MCHGVCLEDSNELEKKKNLASIKKHWEEQGKKSWENFPEVLFP